MTSDSLRLLADENLARALVEALRSDGHDVAWIREIRRTMPDGDVLALAQRDQRILITADKDFGDLVFRARLAADAGVILLRTVEAGPDVIVHRVLESLATDTVWAGHFVVIDEDRVRVTPLPG